MSLSAILRNCVKNRSKIKLLQLMIPFMLYLVNGDALFNKTIQKNGK